MPNRGERSRVDHLAREACRPPMADIARQRKAVDDHGRIFVDHANQVTNQAIRMDGCRVMHVRRPLMNQLRKGLSSLPHLA